MKIDRMFNYSQKNVVIIGGAGILGQQISRAFIAHGAKVNILDRDQKRVDKTVKMIASEYQSSLIKGYCVDITSRSEIKMTSELVKKDFGDVDVLINNAAFKSENFFEPFKTFSEEDWDTVMDVNVKGVMLACQIFGSEMAERGVGNIINTLSIYGIVAPDQRIYEGSLYEGREINTPAVYSTSKAAVWGLTKYLAAYWARNNVRVNAVTPGGVFSGQNHAFVEKYSQRIPMGRMATQDEISGAMLFLSSDAASYITGQNIIVDGGLTIW
jgi:NAD(P)-dependent dehydrogenase (short-subunit alcohol dehydrogenase family)